MKAINQLHLQFLNQILYDYKIENEYCVWLFNYLKDSNRQTYFNETIENAIVVHVRTQFQLRMIKEDMIIYDQHEIFNTIVHSSHSVILKFDNFLKNHRKLIAINFISLMNNAIERPSDYLINQIYLFPINEIQSNALVQDEIKVIKNDLRFKIDASLDQKEVALFMYYSKLLNKLLEVQNDI